jgi:hypothetical protein
MKLHKRPSVVPGPRPHDARRNMRPAIPPTSRGSVYTCCQHWDHKFGAVYACLCSAPVLSASKRLDAWLALNERSRSHAPAYDPTQILWLWRASALGLQHSVLVVQLQARMADRTQCSARMPPPAGPAALRDARPEQRLPQPRLRLEWCHLSWSRVDFFCWFGVGHGSMGLSLNRLAQS